jgi:hypothetical protein
MSINSSISLLTSQHYVRHTIYTNKTHMILTCCIYIERNILNCILIYIETIKLYINIYCILIHCMSHHQMHYDTVPIHYKAIHLLNTENELK